MNTLDLLDSIVRQVDDFMKLHKPQTLKQEVSVKDYSGLLRKNDLEQIHIAAPAIRICWLNDQASKPIALGYQDIPTKFGLTIITRDVVYNKKVVPAHRLAIEMKDKLRAFLPNIILPNVKQVAFFERTEAMDFDLDEKGNKRIYVLDSAFQLTWNQNREDNSYDSLSVIDRGLLEVVDV